MSADRLRELIDALKIYPFHTWDGCALVKYDDVIDALAASDAPAPTNDKLTELLEAANAFRIGSVGSVWVGKVRQVERLDAAMAVFKAEQPPAAVAEGGANVKRASHTEL